MTDEFQTPAEEGPSIRDELAAALNADTEAQASDAPVITTSQSLPTDTPAASESRVRDEQGRFAPKPADQPITQPETPLAGAEPAAQTPQTITPPPSWSAAAKAEFTKLPPVIQQEVLKREGDIERGKAQWDQKAERLNRLDSVLGPRSERYRLAGVDEVTAIQRLFAAEDYLERDPVNALSYLARQVGVDLRQFAQHMPGQEPQGQLPPELQGLVQEVRALRNDWNQTQQATQAETRQTYQQQVTEFASKPENIYFENVRGAMGVLLKNGQAKDLQDAYEQATWADPNVRPILLRQQEESRQAEAQAAQRARVQQARAASGSVTGSPSPGVNPNAPSAPQSVRDALQQAWDVHAA